MPVESLEKHLKSELFDNKNYELMRLLRDRLFKFETEPNWFIKPYKENIEHKKQDDIKRAKPHRMILNILQMKKIYFQFYQKSTRVKGIVVQNFAKKSVRLSWTTLTQKHLRKN